MLYLRNITFRLGDGGLHGSQEYNDRSIACTTKNTWGAG